MAPMPQGVEQGILKGLYRFSKKSAAAKRGKPLRKAHILGSGSILREALRAQEILETYGVAADVWSATSYKELRREALEVERWNMLHPTEKPKKPYVTQLFEKESGPVVAASDYLKLVPDQISRWIPGGLFSLGTDGYGRSDTRESLRRFFEVDAETITVAVLGQLVRQGELKPAVVKNALAELGLDPEKPDPLKV